MSIEPINTTGGIVGNKENTDSPNSSPRKKTDAAAKIAQGLLHAALEKEAKATPLKATITPTGTEKKVDVFVQKTQKTALKEKWFEVYKEAITKCPSADLYEIIKERREEIKGVKEWYLRQQQMARLGDDPHHFKPPEDMEKEVHELLQGGDLEAVADGRSGVYFLRSSDRKIKYVIKPMDEDFLALNNGKHSASPYPPDAIQVQPGVPLYQSVQNGELAYLIANNLKIERATPRTAVLCLHSAQFCDVTDGVEEDGLKLQEIGGVPDREKICLVQEFVPDCINSDSFVLTHQEDGHSINQEQYEECAILSWVLGEKDGNAGNFLIANSPEPLSGKHAVIKIDNGACLADSNEEITTCLEWNDHYSQKISEKGREIILNIDVLLIAKLMKSRGKSSLAIDAMKKRVEALQMLVFMETLPIGAIDQNLEENCAA